MSQSVVPSFSELSKFEFSIPGKSFVLGEYAVLAGYPALLATFTPRFRLTVEAPGTRSSFNSLSPAGRLLDLARQQGVADPGFVFYDLYKGEGGFGASTAQFALAYGALAGVAGWEASATGARRVYRDLLKQEPVPPSGADLVAQWSGGVVCFDPGSQVITSRFESLDWRSLLVFSATGLPGRKVPTHEHLAGLARGLGTELPRQLGKVLDRALNLKSPTILGQAMKNYAQTLAVAGLELDAARRDREALSALPGVLGCKGTGALLADGVVILLEPGTPHRAAVIEAARTRGLVLVADGLGTEPQAGYLCSKVENVK